MDNYNFTINSIQNKPHSYKSSLENGISLTSFRNSIKNQQIIKPIQEENNIFLKQSLKKESRLLMDRVSNTYERVLSKKHLDPLFLQEKINLNMNSSVSKDIFLALKNLKSIDSHTKRVH